MRPGLRPIVVLALLAFGQPAGAAPEKSLLQEFSLKVWNRSHGLPDNHIAALLQTRDGRLWIGTSRGLTRFDGLGFEVFNHSTHVEFESDSVGALAEDTQGRLWVGTAKGLLRFQDGWCRHYTVRDGLPGDDIVKLCAARNGDLWIGTTTGLARQREDRLEVIPMPRGGDPLQNYVRAIHQDAAGRVWFCSDLAVQRWEPDADRIMDVPMPRLQAGTAIQSDLATNVWVVRTHDLVRRLPEPPTVLGPLEDPWGDLLVTRGGQVWLGFTTRRLDRMDDGRWVQFSTGLDQRPADVIHSLLEDRDGNIWAATDKSGLLCLQPRRFTAVTAAEGLPDNNAWTVCPARMGGLWIGTDAGVALWRDGQVVAMPWNTNLANPRIRALHEDADGTLWIGTGDSLEIWSGTTLKTVKWNTEGAWNKIRAITRDRTGDLWIGRAKGLMRWRDGVWTCFGRANGLPEEDVYSLLPDRGGTLWVGTCGGGLCRVELADPAAPASHTAAAQASRIPSGNDSPNAGRARPSERAAFVARTLDVNPSNDPAGSPSSSPRDRSGSGAGPELRVQVFRQADGLPSDYIGTLHEDAAGVLWVGTERGLGRVEFRDGAWRVAAITPRHGLASEEINEILEDGLGRFWLSCDRGIYCVGKAELDAAAAGRGGRARCAWFDEADGMVSAETNGQRSHPAGARTTDGRLWFPTTGGVVSFDPAQILRMSQLVGAERAALRDTLPAEGGPAVVIERVVVDHETAFETAPGRPSPLDVEVPFAPGRARRLEIHYAAPTYRAPDRVRFRYRLRGLEEEWTEAGTRRIAFFANLPPGPYQFAVQAANYRELWGAPTTGFRFRLAPHYYQTTWFWSAAGLVFVLAVLFVLRWRVAEVKRLHGLKAAADLARERERIACDMHDDLGAGLTRLALLGQRVAGEANEASAPRAEVERLVTEASNLVDHLGELIWATDAKYDDLPALLFFLREHAALYLADAHLAARLDFPESAPALAISGVLRRDLLLALKETLHNAVRHARASEITVACHVQAAAAGSPAALELVIVDNGCGFEATAELGHDLPHRRSGQGENRPNKPAPPAPEPPRTGTGLAGLHVRLARHGGSMDLRTAPGQGTTLTLRVPLSGSGVHRP